ncbi:glycine--tRNA ligase subunit beta [Halanaerobiaceae bacterium Z-7014]|uniref:Glycine--tRNA ligase beta subunit n=1 Tax=Halonatronomonas betaini TaxID=2778430 RepID=A0A931F6X2_9FIRM|nr:glycine--tRNA ligase subunit beta [Halonatronomonas betaini]MBF8436031.1 glycine--tRNA ligase subunit beta [Halonatronomonas betaini]
MSNKFVFELGTEEIPAKMVVNLRNNLLRLARESFKEELIEYDSLKTYSTPRRLVLFGQGLSDKQADREEVVRGPSVEIAFDDDGNPTKAGQGFARGQQMEVDDLVERDGYLYAEKVIEGEPTAEVLGRIIPDIVDKLPQPQKMRWGDNEYRFIRPIRWIMALLGEQVIEFELAGLKSNRFSNGHRFLGEAEFKIAKAGDYFERLKDESVIVDQDKREELILKQIDNILAENEEIYRSEGLLEEVVNLVEYPTAFKGSFKDEYLELPEEVLTTSMIEHQRYFPVIKEENLHSAFIGVRNGDSEKIENVIDGNEKVIRARLSDAVFFYNDDISKELDYFNERLNEIVYQEELGSLADKVDRLKKIAGQVAGLVNLTGNDRDNLIRAAKLAKFDLATSMVREFASLQGIMGAKYAAEAGETSEVARAIGQHYKPAGADDSLPESIEARLLSISDKIDDIVSNFYLGNIPTGSQDPFALRRKATGIIRIILDGRIALKLNSIVGIVGDLLEIDTKTEEKVFGFFKQRVENYFSENGIRYDVLDAALAVDFYDLQDLKNRLAAIMKFRNKDYDRFVKLLYGLQRCGNLAAQAEGLDEINSDLIKESEEKVLYDEYVKINDKIEAYFNNDDYYQALEEIAALKDMVDNFLDNIVVMVDDEEVRKNRIGLLERVASLIEPVMDINEIALDEN